MKDAYPRYPAIGKCRFVTWPVTHSKVAGGKRRNGATFVRYQFHRTRNGLVIWQLVGRNNRILGVSPGEFADLADAMRAATVVRDQAREATVNVSPDALSRWRWSIADLDGQILAKAARSYERRTECDQAVDRFRAVAPHADIDPVLGRRGRFWGSSSSRSRQ